MPEPLSKYTPEIVAFAKATQAKAVYCFALGGSKGSGGQPMIGMFDGPALITREEYLARAREVVAMLRRSAELLERDIGDRP